MKKKFLALVLTLAMVLSLVPATALAAGENDPVGTVQSDGTNGVKVIKTATPEKDGNGKATIDMEAYVTGKVTTSTQSTPLDIVLVLDQSGSMAIGGKLGKLKTAATNFINTIVADATEHKVDHRIAVVGFASGKDDYQNTELFVGKTQYKYNNLKEANYKEAFQTVTNETGKSNLTQSINNLDAEGGTHPELGMKMANNIFRTNSDENGTRQRIVVMFTDGEPGDYEFDDAVANATVAQAYETKHTYGATVYTVGLISDPGDEVTKFLSKVSYNYPDAQAYEGPYSYSPVYNVDTNSKYYVESGDSYKEVHYNSYLENWYAKDWKKYIPKTGANDTNKKHTQFYSRQETTTAQYDKYYMHTGNAGELNNIFSNIAQDTTHAKVEVKATSEMRDELSNFFVFDGIECNDGTVTSGVKVTKVAAQGSGSEPAWASDGTDITKQVTVKVVGDKITVTGFDYSSGENCVVKKTGTGWQGHKLVLSFNVKPNVKCYDWKEEKNYDTNKITEGSQAGLYYGDSGSTVLNESPQVPVPTYQVIYDWGTSGVTTPVTDSRYYISGQNATVDYTTVEKGDAVKGSNDKLYRFSGWSENGTVVDDVGITNHDVTLTPVLTEAYTVIFDANGGAWDNGKETVTQPYESSSSLVIRPKNDPTKFGSTFVDWAYKDAGGTFQSIGQNPFMGIRVSTLQQLSGVTGNSVTLYAVWKDNDTAPTGSLNYRINQYFIDETGKVANSISKPGRNTVDTAISTLISDLIPQDRSFPNYQYEEAKTTVNDKKYNGNEKLAQDDTVINLYYYLDSWKDGDTDPDNTTDDSLTDGDGIPDCKQILIQYQVYQEGNGQVSPTFEVVTVNDNGTKTEIKGSTATATPKYVFVTWTKGKVTDKNVGELATTISTEKHCTPVSGELEVGQPYTYTAIFLEDKVGKKDKDGNDTGDGIPDAWQYKVTFKVVHGKWNNQTTADVVAYVTNKKNGIPCAKGTEGSKATLDGVPIPGAGNQPNSGYKASGNWGDITPSATTVITKEDTVFTYTYDQKSGGSGGSGGSHKPTVTIPDDVPTGLNGKDHYAYVVGYPDGMVYPQKNITRAEVATIFFRLLKDETREANMTKSNSYNDMKDGAWYTCAVSTLSKMGIIKGYEDGSFKPDASISRAEFAAIAARFDPDGDKTPATFSDVSSHWAKDEISIAANHGWIKGYEDGSFKPDQKITRAETMTLVNRVLKRLPETKDDLHKDMKTWPDNQNESAWFYLAVQEATNSHYQKLKKDGTHETWESMRETRDWAALEK